MRKARWIGAASGLMVAMLAAPAWAEPRTSGALQFGVGFRYGIDQQEGDFNPWGTGVGLTGGYTLPLIPIYVGGNAEYFFGSEAQQGAIKLTGKLWQITAEGGYDIGLGENFVLRPKIGLGLATLSSETCTSLTGCNKDSESKSVVAPGATFMLFTDHFGLSLDVRYDMVLTDPVAKAIIFSVGIGF
jgi:hypothetical protein